MRKMQKLAPETMTQLTEIAEAMGRNRLETLRVIIAREYIAMKAMGKIKRQNKHEEERD